MGTGRIRRCVRTDFRLSPLLVLLLLLQNGHSTLELDAKTFKQLVSSGRNGMIKFYQPWCGHCTRMKPDWDQLAEAVPDPIFIADVNCSEQDKLCKDNDVQGYPTVRVYRNGVEEHYRGGRGFEMLLDFVNANLVDKCDVNRVEETCDPKAVPYIEKWKTKTKPEVEVEMERLQGLLASSHVMKSLKEWLRERLVILQQILEQATSATDEL